MPRRTVTDAQIVEAYGELKSGQAVSDRLGVSTPTVYKVLRAHGIDRETYLAELRKGGFSDEEIVAVYLDVKSADRAQKILGINRKRFDNALRRCGIERFGHEFSKLERRALTDEQEAEVCKAFQGGELLSRIARRFEVAKDTIRATLHRAGISHMREVPARRDYVPEAERLRILDLYESGLPMRKVGKLVGRTEATVRRYLQLDRPDLIRPQRPRGAASPTWKGGRTVDKQGYVYLRVDPADELAVAMGHCHSKRGRSTVDRVMEHRLVMARHLGRPLRSSETVHHINGDKTDNRIENLQLRNGRHGKGLMLRCRRCGCTDFEEVALD